MLGYMEWPREILGGIFPALLLLFVWLYRWSGHMYVFPPLRRHVADYGHRYEENIKPGPTRTVWILTIRSDFTLALDTRSEATTSMEVRKKMDPSSS